MGTLTRENPWLVGLKSSGSNLVAKVWSGNDTLSRSPKDSPPVEKKRLRRLNTTWLYKQRAPLASLDDAFINDASSDETKSATLPIRARSSSVPRSIIKRNASVSCPIRSYGNDKKVTFRPQVTVEYMDETKHIRTELEDLNMEPRDRQRFMSRNLSRINQLQQLQIQNQYSQFSSPTSCDQTDSANINGSLSSPPHLPTTFEANKNLYNNSHNSNMDNNNVTSDKPQVNIYFIPDKQQGTKMKMVVNIGAQFHPDEICVKANMSGNKVRVMASKIVQNADGSQNIEPINERFLLPMEVDPYAVEARLDTKGHLTIEAPLLTHARRTAISQGQSTAAKAISL